MNKYLHCKFEKKNVSMKFIMNVFLCFFCAKVSELLYIQNWCIYFFFVCFKLNWFRDECYSESDKRVSNVSTYFCMFLEQYINILKWALEWALKWIFNSNSIVFLKIGFFLHPFRKGNIFIFHMYLNLLYQNYSMNDACNLEQCYKKFYFVMTAFPFI